MTLRVGSEVAAWQAPRFTPDGMRTDLFWTLSARRTIGDLGAPSALTAARYLLRVFGDLRPIQDDPTFASVIWHLAVAVLAANCSDTDTTILVRNGDAFVGRSLPFQVIMGGEVVSVDAMPSATFWEVTRAQRGTTAQPHYAGARLAG